MKTTLSLALLAATIASSASTVVIDDFAGGPDVVNLTSLAPPEIATGSFPHAGALGGVRDVAVWSFTAGEFGAGVAFASGGYASFAGTGAGGIVWDGVAGISDSNNSKSITPDELDYGLSADLSDCADGTLDLTAFADLPNAVLRIAFATDAGNFNRYDIPLTGPLGLFNDYSVDLGSPTSTVGTIDFGNIGAIALFVDGSGFANLDVRVSNLEVSCPDGGSTTIGLMGLGFVALGLFARRMGL